jgi:periplasmic copper chaperone A
LQAGRRATLRGAIFSFGFQDMQMRSNLPRRSLLHLGLASTVSLSGLMLSRPAQACDFSTRFLRVTHPWTRASADDATSAVVCMKFDQVLEDDRLIGVDTMVATDAELGTNVGGVSTQASLNFRIPKGQTSLLSEEATFLRLLGLKLPLEVGRAYPMQLTFEKGGNLMTDLNVSFARFA